MKILVIDDEKPTLSMFRLFLTAYGYEVHTAESGEAGLALFNTLAPEIVFTDIRMPGMDGLEVLRQIRQNSTRTQVIIITGHGDMEMAIQALDLDASDFINKPVERAALDSALARAEQRTRLPHDPPFDLELRCQDRWWEITVSGRVTQSAQPRLEALLAQGKGARIQEVTVEFGPGFSINREGMGVLMDHLAGLKEMGVVITLKGLSYNYARFFEMAGMNRLARIEAGPDAEPGH
jgi:DNA-binding response OmpR family regulator